LRGEVSVKISKTGKIEDNFTVALLKAGQGFGELALINDAPRAATIITETRCELIKVESVKNYL
jgi:CRP-like cAMP-binding protein